MIPFRVMIVDDSALIRMSLTQILKSDGQIEVIGTASDGLTALEKIEELRPDVVILDIHMPRMDGLQVLHHLMEDCPRPVIMFSSATTAQAEITLQALRMGAVDFVTKPRGSLTENLRYLRRELINKVKMAKTARLQRKPRETPGFTLKETGFPQRKPILEPSVAHPSITADEIAMVVIGCSTGGPGALEKIIPSLPKDFPGAIGVVQHMPEPFSKLFASQLDQISEVKVKVAEQGEPFRPGQVLMAPGDANLCILRQGNQFVAKLDPSQEKQPGWMPSVDLFFCSAARASAEKTVGVLLTGMGRDGAKGMAAIKIMGGMTIAQDESSSVVFGMPRAAIESGTVDKVVPLELIPALIERLLSEEVLIDFDKRKE